MVKKVSMMKKKGTPLSQQFDLLSIINETGQDYCKQQHEAMMIKSQNAGYNLNLQSGNHDSEVSDFPSCDFCGDENGGKLFCSQCRCVFYCSKQCQKHHWKAPEGHKVHCTNMEKVCKDKAQSFMDAFEKYKTCVSVFHHTDNVVGSAFFNLIMLLRNDGVNQNGPYKKALELGLNQALFFLFQDECKHVVDRFKQGIRVTVLDTIHRQLFNNDRKVPGHLPGGTFNSIDGYRVKKYLRSRQDAFEEWFAASLKTFEIYQTQGFDALKRKQLDLYFGMKKNACNVAHVWSLVFTNKKAAKVILLGDTKEVDDKARERAQWIISELKHVYSNFVYDKRIISICSSDKALHSSVSAVEGSVHHFTALIEGRMNEYQIDVGDFRQLIGLKGTTKFNYENLAIPWANAIIEKGAMIDNGEADEALMKQALFGSKSLKQGLFANKNTAKPSSQVKGKKKGKKKSKK